jgi:hypothetical protein
MVTVFVVISYSTMSITCETDVYATQVDGRTVSLPYVVAGAYTIDYFGDSVRLQTSFGLIVKFDGGSKVSVLVPRSIFRGKTHGMCGADSGNADDDYRMNSGSYIGRTCQAGTTIGDSYVVPDSEVTDSK